MQPAQVQVVPGAPVKPPPFQLPSLGPGANIPGAPKPAMPAASPAEETVPPKASIDVPLRTAPDPELRLRAAELQARLKEPAGLEDFLWALGDPEPSVRAVAVARVGKIPAADLLQQVLNVLVANHESDLNALDLALPELPPALGTEFLGLFRNHDLAIPLRRAAAYSVGRMRVAGAAGSLAQGAWEEDASLALSCARALYALRDTQTIRDWAAMRTHPDPSVRVLAVYALAELGGREAFAALAEIAYGGDFDARLAPIALQGIAAWPLSDCVPALIEVMKRNPGRKVEAADLLRVRTGQALGNSIEEWQDWYVNGPAPAPEPEPEQARGQEQYTAQDLLGHAQFVPPELRGF